MKRLVVFFLLVPALLAAQQKRIPPKTPDELREGCKTFVKSFYDWYVPKAATSGAEATVRALKEKPQFFSRPLVQQLKDDAAAQAASPNDVVGLDGDPFLNCQDCPRKYKMGETHLSGYKCTIDIMADKGDGSGDSAIVTPEGMYTMNHWIFTNFEYPQGSDLVATLKQLKEKRGGK